MEQINIFLKILHTSLHNDRVKSFFFRNTGILKIWTLTTRMKISLHSLCHEAQVDPVSADHP